MNKSLRDELETWIGMWHKQIVSARDAAITAERLFARGLPPDEFHSLPEAVRRQVLHDLDVFAVEGVRTLAIAHAPGEPFDDSDTMRLASAALISAGIWSRETSSNLGPPENLWAFPE